MVRQRCRWWRWVAACCSHYSLRWRMLTVLSLGRSVHREALGQDGMGGRLAAFEDWQEVWLTVAPVLGLDLLCHASTEREDSPRRSRCGRGGTLFHPSRRSMLAPGVSSSDEHMRGVGGEGAAGACVGLRAEGADRGGRDRHPMRSSDFPAEEVCTIHAGSRARCSIFRGRAPRRAHPCYRDGLNGGGRGGRTVQQ